MERKVVGLRWDQRIASREIRRIAGGVDVGNEIKRLKMSFSGNLVETKEESAEGRCETGSLGIIKG